MIERFGMRAIAMAAGGILIMAVLLFGVSQCEKRRNAASQARVEQSQAQAAQDSAKDAINAVEASGARESASEELTRTNDKDIRSADGANQRIPTGVDVAGRKALCRRAAYAKDPKCKAMKP